jgi:hypothetical protein
MMRTKQASKRKSRAFRPRSAVLPVLGAAGLSLAMASNTSATVPATNLPFQGTGPRVTLSEEEISDVSLATFYVFDRENDARPPQDLILARGGCGGGCGGHGCGGGCGGRGCGSGCGGRGCGGHGCAGCRACGGGGCGGGIWIGGCLGCGGGCGTCWRWAPRFGRWIWAC